MFLLKNGVNLEENLQEDKMHRSKWEKAARITATAAMSAAVAVASCGCSIPMDRIDTGDRDRDSQLNALRDVAIIVGTGGIVMPSYKDEE